MAENRTENQNPRPDFKQKEDPPKRSYVKPPQNEKLKAGSKINLNTADSALLMRIPGIGEYYAKNILKYRELLGGYCSIEQLRDVRGMREERYEQMLPFFETPIIPYRLIQINKASFDQLQSHPYIKFYRAKAIIELRNKNGSIPGPEALSILEEFPPDTLKKITPYLLFN